VAAANFAADFFSSAARAFYIIKYIITPVELKLIKERLRFIIHK
jgi:hypothetical protein